MGKLLLKSNLLTVTVNITKVTEEVSIKSNFSPTLLPNWQCMKNRGTCVPAKELNFPCSLSSFILFPLLSPLPPPLLLRLPLIRASPELHHSILWRWRPLSFSVEKLSYNLGLVLGGSTVREMVHNGQFFRLVALVPHEQFQ